MTRSSQTVWLVLVTLVLCAATHAGADDGKTYRWVGHDGRVYTTPTPPPEGAGTIVEVVPAKPKKGAPAPAAAAEPSLSPLRRFLKEAAAAERESQEREAEAQAAAAAAAPEEPGNPCARYTNWISSWRYADQGVQNAEDNLERLQSDTRGFMTSNESGRLARMDAAEKRVEAAEERLSQVESDAASAGVPSNCLTQ